MLANRVDRRGLPGGRLLGEQVVADVRGDRAHQEGGTEFPTLAHFSTNLPSILNSAGKDDSALISLIVRCLFA